QESGSPRHLIKWLQPLQERKYTGMFAVTEEGPGSSTRGSRPKPPLTSLHRGVCNRHTGENSQKMHIGNAMYGDYAAVFAQLIEMGHLKDLIHLHPRCAVDDGTSGCLEDLKKRGIHPNL
ncbi:Acyl-coenzyme A oxidase-like protein, partial [Manis javanica]